MALLAPVYYAGGIYAARWALETTFPPLSSDSYSSSNDLRRRIREIYENNIKDPKSVFGSFANFLYDNLHFMVGFDKSFCPAMGFYGMNRLWILPLFGAALSSGRSRLSDLCNRIAENSQTPCAELARQIAAFVRPNFYIEPSAIPSNDQTVGLPSEITLRKNTLESDLGKEALMSTLYAANEMEMIYQELGHIYERAGFLVGAPLEFGKKAFFSALTDPTCLTQAIKNVEGRYLEQARQENNQVKVDFILERLEKMNCDLYRK
jgi:hypothetical protein